MLLIFRGVNHAYNLCGTAVACNISYGVLDNMVDISISGSRTYARAYFKSTMSPLFMQLPPFRSNEKNVTAVEVTEKMIASSQFLKLG